MNPGSDAAVTSAARSAIARRYAACVNESLARVPWGRAPAPHHHRRPRRARGRRGCKRRDPAPEPRPGRDDPLHRVAGTRARACRAAARLLGLEEALSGHLLPARPACERGRLSRQRLADRRARARRRRDPRHPQGARVGDRDPEYLNWGAGRNWETYVATEVPRYVD